MEDTQEEESETEEPKEDQAEEGEVMKTAGFDSGFPDTPLMKMDLGPGL